MKPCSVSHAGSRFRARVFAGACLALMGLGALPAGVYFSGQREAAWAEEAADAKPPVAVERREVDFARDVQPIFQRRCYECHAAEANEGGLRLHHRESALAGGDSGKVILAGNSGESELLKRIASDDAFERMPPEDAGEALTAEEIGIIRRWIDRGANWPDDAAGELGPSKHWSFQGIERPELPPVKRADWVRTPIDRFVLARLEEEQLAPQPELDRARLIRRVSLDLIGIPPTPEEVEAFVNDSDPDAYEKLVDRLLASPRFGERWAAVWLDMARYADTQGYEKDNRRTIWPYRDWVIRAMNDDMPYDQFTLEQIAGDLLPNATVEQRVATAFHRNTMTNTEGGTDNEEFRDAAVVDRVNTTMQVWMGLTFGCCQCHSHKYDPFTQKEYYQVYAFLNQTADADNDNEAPVMRVPNDYAGSERGRLQEERAKLIERRDALRTAWQAEHKADDGAAKATDVFWIDDELPGGAKRNGNEGENSWQWFERGEHPVFRGERATRRQAKEISQHYFTDASPGLPVSEGDKLIAHVYLDPADLPAQIVLQFHVNGSWEHRAYWGENRVPWGRDGEPSRKRLGDLPAAGEWARLEVDPAEVGVAPGNEIRGWAFSQFGGTVYWDAAGIETRHAAAALLANEDFVELSKQLAALDAREQEIATQEPSIPVMVELGDHQRRKTHVHIRGSFLSKGDEVGEATPAVLHAFDERSPRNRLGFAQWLVDERNPLTARVLVNRYWEKVFGIGLVETSEDFGKQGTPPSHPELLDWLADEFRREGWSRKKLLRLIVTSAAYRQRSHVTPELWERDPYNRLLARGPRVRLTAEQVRDQALTIAGLLSEKMYGPSVMPPQPEGIWAVVYNGDQWVTPHGEDRYRRGLYTFWRRTSPYPSMLTFDAVSREFCVIRRSRTNTPLQALVTLNDPVYVEAAQALARRAVREVPAEGDVDDLIAKRIDRALRLALARPAETKEIEALTALYQQQLAHYREREDEANKMATQPLGPIDEALAKQVTVSELAAWTVVANALLNVDEIFTK